MEALVVEDRIKIIKGRPLQSNTYRERRGRAGKNTGYTMKGKKIGVAYAIIVV